MVMRRELTEQFNLEKKNDRWKVNHDTEILY